MNRLEQGSSPGGIRVARPSNLDMLRARAAVALDNLKGMQLPQLKDIALPAASGAVAAGLLIEPPAIVQAQEVPKNQIAVVAAKPLAENPVVSHAEAEPAVALTGTFVESRFIPDGLVNGERVGYFVDSAFSQEYAQNGKVWGEPRTNRWITEDGSSIKQLFDNALVQYDAASDSTNTVQIYDALKSQASAEWLAEYGITQNTPAWIIAAYIDSGNFIPAETKIPVKQNGLPIYEEGKRPAPITVKSQDGNLTLTSEDPVYGFSIDNQQIMTSFLSLINPIKRKVTAHMVTDANQIPSALGYIQPDDPKEKSGITTTASNMPGYVSYARFSYIDPAGEFHYYFAAQQLHDANLPDENRMQRDVALYFDTRTSVILMAKVGLPLRKIEKGDEFFNAHGYSSEDAKRISDFITSADQNGTWIFRIFPI